MDHSFFNICDKFLRLNKICLDRASIKEQLYTQDSYPSLNAVTDVLSAFGIEHRALRIGWDQLMEYGTPAMLHYQGRMPRFVIATRVTESEITYYTSGLRKKTEPRGDFLKHWDGTSLYVIEPESFPWKCYLANEFKGHRLQLLFATTVLFLLSLWGILPVEKDLFLYTSSILKIIGLLVSIFLLRHDWGKSSRTEHNFCTLAKTFSCDAVLGSKASKLFGVIKMSDIGIVYFTGGLAYLLFSSFGITDSQTTLDILFIELPTFKSQEMVSAMLRCVDCFNDGDRIGWHPIDGGWIPASFSISLRHHRLVLFDVGIGMGSSEQLHQGLPEHWTERDPLSEIEAGCFCVSFHVGPATCFGDGLFRPGYPDRGSGEPGKSDHRHQPVLCTLPASLFRSAGVAERESGILLLEHPLYEHG